VIVEAFGVEKYRTVIHVQAVNDEKNVSTVLGSRNAGITTSAGLG
jgi:hypothetical protein